MKSLIFKSKQGFFNDAINSYVKNPKKLWAGMHEITGLKSNSATNYIQDKDGNIIKNAYSAQINSMNTSVAFTRYLKTQQSHPQTSILAG